MAFSGLRSWHGVVVAFGLVLLCAGSAQAESVLNFPRLTNQPGTITGFTFVNPNEVPAAISATAYGRNGDKIAGVGIQNPAQLLVPPNQQLGLVATDLFGSGLRPDTVGWVQATSPVDGITGFFLFLDNPASPTELDGADLPPLDRKVIFNHIRVGAGYSTELNLFNTEDVASIVDLLLIDNESITQRTLGSENPLPGMGLLRIDDVAAFFDVEQASEEAYVLIISDTLVGGFELVRQPQGDLLGLNARSAGEWLNTIYFPQLAVLGPWKMQIGIVNYSPAPVAVEISAYRPDGTFYGTDKLTQNRIVRNIRDGGILVEDVEALFGFKGQVPLDGWIKVNCTSGAINGWVSYGVPGSGSIASVAAPARAQREAVFSHIATTRGFFTGVAALNASAFAADVRIVTMTAKNEVLGSVDMVLKPGERVSKTLQEMIPEAGGQSGGIIWVKSSQSIYLTALFGTTTGSVLSNVPPQPALAAYAPDSGTSRLNVLPDFTVVEVGGTQQFSASIESVGPQASAAAVVDWFVEGVPGGDEFVGTLNPAGLYGAPTELPEMSPVTVTAVEQPVSPGGDREVIAGATVDLLDPIVFEESLPETTRLVVLPDSRRLFSVLQEGTTSTVVEITQNEFIDIFSYPNEEILGAAPFRASNGQEFLLLGGRQRLIRLDPDLQGPSSVDVLTGLQSQYRVLTSDPVTGVVLAADAAGVAQVSAARIEADLVSSATGVGGPPVRLFENSDIGGLAADGCTGRIYFSRRGPGSISFFSRNSGGIQEAATGLMNPESLLMLNRKDTVCPSASHLFVSEPGGHRVSLMELRDSALRTWAFFENPGNLAFLPADQELFPSEAILVLEGQSLGSVITLVDTLNLYQLESVNPIEVLPSGVKADPAFDPHGSETFQHDVVQLSAFFDSDFLVVEAHFADLVEPCEDPCLDSALNPANALTGVIDLDLDQDPATGVISLVDLNSPASTGIGVEIFADLGTYLSSSQDIVIYDEAGEFIGVALTQFGDSSVRIEIPKGLMGPDAKANVAAVFGTIGEPTDAVPNRGPVVTVPWAGPGPLSHSAEVLRSPSSSSSRSSVRPTRTRGWKGRPDYAQSHRR